MKTTVLLILPVERCFVVAEKMLWQSDDADAEADEADFLLMPSKDSFLSGNGFILYSLQFFVVLVSLYV